jgi:hypothetical protein
MSVLREHPTVMEFGPALLQYRHLTGHATTILPQRSRLFERTTAFRSHRTPEIRRESSKVLLSLNLTTVTYIAKYYLVQRPGSQIQILI